MWGERYSKYSAERTEYNGRSYASKFEAGVAYTLDIRKRAGEILDWEPQFKVSCVPYNCHGDPVPECEEVHYVDFRVHEHDGSFTLLEAKGFETTAYRKKRRWLEKFWLPEHPDHVYSVVKQGKKGWYSRPR